MPCVANLCTKDILLNVNYYLFVYPCISNEYMFKLLTVPVQIFVSEQVTIVDLADVKRNEHLSDERQCFDYGITPLVPISDETYKY